MTTLPLTGCGGPVTRLLRPLQVSHPTSPAPPGGGPGYLQARGEGPSTQPYQLEAPCVGRRRGAGIFGHGLCLGSDPHNPFSCRGGAGDPLVRQSLFPGAKASDPRNLEPHSKRTVGARRGIPGPQNALSSPVSSARPLSGLLNKGTVVTSSQPRLQAASAPPPPSIPHLTPPHLGVAVSLSSNLLVWAV